MTFTIHSDLFPQTVVNSWIAKFLPTDVQIIEINMTRKSDEDPTRNELDDEYDRIMRIIIKEKKERRFQTYKEIHQKLDKMISKTEELSKQIDEDFEELRGQLKRDFQELRSYIR